MTQMLTWFFIEQPNSKPGENIKVQITVKVLFCFTAKPI